MLKKTEVIVLLTIIFSLLYPSISLAQELPEKYIIISFVESRSIVMNRRTQKIRENYYWISPLDSLVSKQKVFPLFLSCSSEYAILPERVLGLEEISLTNFNGKINVNTIFHDSDVEVVQQLVRTVEHNKKRVQSVKTTYQNDKTSSIKRKNKILRVYVTYIYGIFQKRQICGKRNIITDIFFPVYIEESNPVYLNDEERRALFFFDYSNVDNSELSIPQSVFDQGFGRISTLGTIAK